MINTKTHEFFEINSMLYDNTRYIFNFIQRIYHIFLAQHRKLIAFWWSCHQLNIPGFSWIFIAKSSKASVKKPGHASTEAVHCFLMMNEADAKLSVAANCLMSFLYLLPFTLCLVFWKHFSKTYFGKAEKCFLLSFLRQ